MEDYIPDMSNQELADKANFIGFVASEAADNPGAIAQHPEIVDVLRDLTSVNGFKESFGGNGHDPDAYVEALAEALTPYQQTLMDDAPELVVDLGFLAWTLKG